jgi:hypothetical protein
MALRGYLYRILAALEELDLLFDNLTPSVLLKEVSQKYFIF